MIKLILIEDDAGLRTIVGGLLSAMGYAVVEAEDARSGLAAVLKHKPDVIVSDFLMPGVLGDPKKNLFAELASRPETASIPVIIASGLPKETVKDNVPERFWPNIVSKPFDYLRLQGVIEAALKRK